MDIVLNEAEKMLKALPRGSRVVAGLSGGADSVCLLTVLNMLAPKLGFELYAVHVNHCLRGSESDGDCDFCVALCERIGVKLFVRRVDVKKYAAESGKSTEEAARDLRYGAFYEAAEEVGGAFVATAHNLNDNAETVIHNMTRGTGLKGLCGIPLRRDNIIRPLLNVSRADIEAFLAENGQDFVTDSTNLSDDYTRNRIRHRIIPELAEINGGFLRNMGRLAENLREDNDFIEKASMVSDSDAFKLENAPRKRYIIRRLKAAGIEPDSGKIERADDVLLHGGRQQLCGDVFAFRAGGILNIGRIMPKNTFSDFSAPLSEGENIFADGRRVCWERINLCKFCDIHNYVTNSAVDCDKIQGVPIMRTRREGDEIMLPHEGFHRKLRKIYNTMKIPPHLRDSAVIIADGEGILFAEYVGVSARAVCGENTHSVGRIRIYNDDE